MQIESRYGGRSFRARVRRKGAPDISKTFTSRADAVEWATAAARAVERGTLAEFRNRDTTLGELLERYGREVSAGKKGARQERSRIRLLLKSKLARLSVQHLTRAAIREWRDRQTQGPGLNRSLSLVAAALRWAKAECDVPCDPGLVGGLKVPEGAARTRRLAPGEEERLLAAARGTAEQGGLPGADEGNPGVWLTSAITLLVETGMRRSEAWALQWRDVDLGRRVARLATTKNGDRGVEIPLSTRALAALQALPRGIGAARVLAGFGCPNTLGDAFRAACKAAGITGLRLHDLRAECVSRLFERGLTLPEVRAVSRHKSAALLRYVRAGDAAELARKLG